MAAAVLAALVALRLDLGCSADASDAIQNVACDPRTGALDVLRGVLLVLGPLAALAGAAWCLFLRGGRRALWLGGGLALTLVMGAGDVGGAMTPDDEVPRVERVAAERSRGAVAAEVFLTGRSLLLVDFGRADRLPLSVEVDGRRAVPRDAGGFGPGYLLPAGEHRLTVAAPRGTRTLRVEAVLPGAGNQRDRTRGPRYVRLPSS